MMTTEEARFARLTDYVEGVLSDEDARVIDELLETDEDLRQEVDDARAARALLGGLEAPPVPRDFLRKVQRRARHKARGQYLDPSRNPLMFGVSVEIFAVIAVAAMAVCWFFIDRAGHRPPARLQWEVSAPKAPTGPGGE
jgi:anti-sigma-K factor RskA